MLGYYKAVQREQYISYIPRHVTSYASTLFVAGIASLANRRDLLWCTFFIVFLAANVMFALFSPAISRCSIIVCPLVSLKIPQNPESNKIYRSIPYALAHCQKPISQCVMYMYILSLSVYCHACIVTVVCAYSTTVLSIVLFGHFGHYFNIHLLTYLLTAGPL